MGNKFNDRRLLFHSAVSHRGHSVLLLDRLQGTVTRSVAVAAAATIIGVIWNAAPRAEEEVLFGLELATAEDIAAFPKVGRYRAFLPESVDMSGDMPTPGDQGRLNSCTGWAVGYAARSYYAKTVDKRPLGSRANVPSPAFLYNAIRRDSDCSTGSKIPEALVQLQSGAYSIADYPYKSSSCRKLAPDFVARASDFKIKSGGFVDPKILDDVKGQLATGNPVIFGMTVGRGFERWRGSKVYSGSKRKLGPHAMTAVGYDDRRQAFKVINSWGREWGERGFGWIAYTAFKEDAHEAWVMRVVPKSGPQPVPSVTPEVVITPPPPAPKPVVVVVPRPKPEPKPVPPVPPLKPVTSAPKPIERPIQSGDCSSVTETHSGSVVVIKGFVENDVALDSLRRSYDSKAASFDVAIRPWPQCEVLMTLSRQLVESDGLSISAQDGKAVYKNNDTISLVVRPPSKPSYLYISYIQANGDVVHLEQPDMRVLAPSGLGPRIFGDGQAEHARFVAKAPFGKELAIVIASASPLFDKPLPTKQTEREFLTALRKSLIYKSDPALPDRVIAASVLPLETRE